MTWKTVADTPEELKPPPGITYSDYQVAVFDTVTKNLGTGQHLMVQAVAGSGKSFTGVEIFRMLPRYTNAQFIAFNKPIANDLDIKLKPLCESVT